MKFLPLPQHLERNIETGIVKRHLVSGGHSGFDFGVSRDTLADRVRVHIDSAHDVTGEAEKIQYRSLAATDFQNLE